MVYGALFFHVFCEDVVEQCRRVVVVYKEIDVHVCSMF